MKKSAAAASQNESEVISADKNAYDNNGRASWLLDFFQSLHCIQSWLQHLQSETQG